MNILCFHPQQLKLATLLKSVHESICCYLMLEWCSCSWQKEDQGFSLPAASSLALCTVLRMFCSSPLPWLQVGQQGCSWDCRSNLSPDKVDQIFVGADSMLGVRVRKGNLFDFCFALLSLMLHLLKSKFQNWNAVVVISAVLLFLYITVHSHKGLGFLCLTL